MKDKKSFFERLTGAVRLDDSRDTDLTEEKSDSKNPDWLKETEDEDGQLAVDVHQTPSEIIIRAFVAGVRPDELSISISRDMVEIEGSRMEREQVAGPDYFTRELFWGSFSRAIMLPQEVDVEASSASAKDGLVTIILPKLDKAKQTKLRVKAG